MKNYSTLLKVSGIILIIFNSLAILTNSLSLFTYGSDSIVEILGQAPTTIQYVSLIITIILNVVTLVFAIIGVANSANPPKYKLVIGTGIGIFVITFISKLYPLLFTNSSFADTTNTNLDTSLFFTLSIVNLFIALILPSLYLVGGFSLKKIQARLESYDEELDQGSSNKPIS